MEWFPVLARIRFPRSLCAALLAVSASPALAQSLEAGEPPAPIRAEGNSFTIGAGVGLAPDYEGSNDYRLQPGGLLQGRIGGVEFQMRGLNLYSNVIAPQPGKRTSLVLGPVVQLRLDRTGKIEDSRVRQLGTRGTAVELGLVAGIGQRGVLIPPDKLSFDVTVLRDVTGTHSSTIVTPAISYGTPVSSRGYTRLGISADHVGAGFARTYFDVAPLPVADALPAYATRGGGWKSVGANLLYTHDLGGDPRKGAGLFGLAGYKRLLGQFADSPIVRDAGQAGQAFGMMGLIYSF